MILLLLIANIVAGESAYCTDCKLVIACNVKYDIYNDIDPTTRWYGWSEPDVSDIWAAWQAIRDECKNVPRCRFLGSHRDLAKWKKRGWVNDSDILKVYTDGTFTSICVIEEEAHGQLHQHSENQTEGSR